MRNNVIYILLLSVFSMMAQENMMLSGKIYSNTYPLKGVLVVNLSQQKETRSDNEGEFSIRAAAGDTVVFTGTGINELKINVTTRHLQRANQIQVVTNSSYELAELVVEKDNKLTAEGLRIIPKGAARYTPAERKMQTGGRIGPRSDASAGGGIVFNGDAIINIFNGRRKALKKALETEQSEKLLELLMLQYDTETIIKRFKIAENYVQGFLFYAAADASMSAALKADNAAMVDELMAVLALKYTDLLNEK